MVWSHFQGSSRRAPARRLGLGMVSPEAGAILRFTLAAVLCLPACNAIMGIEPAELRGTGGAGQGGAGQGGSSNLGTGGAVVTPVVNTPCGLCLTAKCKEPMDACLAQTDCRAQLSRVTNCLAADPSDSGCIEKLAQGELFDCIVGNCSSVDNSVCAGSALISTCELYCACMSTQCSAYPLEGDCIGACSKLGEAKASCRLTHCQVASGVKLETHCNHARALGPDPCGPVNVAEPCTAGINLSGSPRGGGCNVNKDCCFDDCNSSGFCTR
ncbi:MAG TPA: hypothetical protein VG937_07645 [Polyangiaceae bacterium]|nr:hypothetical protein [Polyangiaceae bacterium]